MSTEPQLTHHHPAAAASLPVDPCLVECLALSRRQINLDVDRR
jgi:hypothetical protein